MAPPSTWQLYAAKNTGAPYVRPQSQVGPYVKALRLSWTMNQSGVVVTVVGVIHGVGGWLAW